MTRPAALPPGVVWDLADPLCAHFATRVRERIPGVPPRVLWEGIVWAIARGRDDLVRFEGRLDRRGRRLWSFRAATGGVFCAVVDGDPPRPLTVLTPGMVSGKPIFERDRRGLAR